MNLRRSFLVAGAALLLVSTGCGKSKVTQCNALIDKWNAANETVTKAPDPSDDATAKAFGEALTKGASTVSTAEVEDPKLKEFRDNYAKALNESAAAMKAVVEAPGEPKAEDVAKMKAGVAAATKQQEGLAAYCKD